MDQYTVVQQQPTAEKQGNGYAVAALTLGILSLLFFCCCAPISLVTSILAIVFALLSKEQGGLSGQAIAGIICAGLALLLILLCIIGLCAFFNDFDSAAVSELLAELQREDPALYDELIQAYPELFSGDDGTVQP